MHSQGLSVIPTRGEARWRGGAMEAAPIADSWGAGEVAAILDSAGAGIWALDLEGRCVYVNRAACQILGYTREECLGRKMQCKIHSGCPEGCGRPNNACRFQKAIESGAAVVVDDDVIHHRDGTLTAARYSVQPVIVGGRVRGSVISISEITEQTRAKAALDQFFSASPTPLAIWNLDGRIRRVNPAWEVVLGLTAAESEGLQVLDLAHPEDRAGAEAAFEALLVSGKREGFECRVRCKNGSYRWLVVNAGVLEDAQAIYATAHDITERKRAEEALRESEERFRSTFENTLFGMAVVSPGGRYLQVNRSLCRMLGFTEQEMLRADFLDLTHPDDVQNTVELRDAMLAGRTSSGTLTKRYVCQDGRPISVYTHVALVRDAQGAPLHFTSVIEDLTDRQCAEEAARNSEEWLALSLNAAGVGLCYRESGETTASEQQFRLYGLEPAEEWLTRERWLQAIHPEDRERVEAEQQKAVDRADSYDIRFRVVWPDGSVHWLLCRGKVLHDKGIGRKVEVTVDITGRQRAEQALEEFFSISPSAMAIITFDGRIQRANAALLRISGFTVEELGERPMLEFFHPDDRAAMEAELRRLIAHGGNAEFECRGFRRDGSITWLLFSATAVPDEAAIFTVAHDITGRKRAEEALRANERILSESQRVAHVGSWSWDLATGALAWTPETYRLHGVSPDTFVPSRETLLGLIHPEDRAALQTWLAACRAGAEPSDVEFRSILPDGGIRDILGRGHLERDAENKPVGMSGIAQDITERKRMVKALELHASKLAASNVELERFAYVASHDLQEPLRMVASFTQLLSKKYSGRLDETADRYINFAVDGAKRMQQLIADLLAYSRVNSKDLDLRPTECGHVVRATLHNLAAAIEESGAIVECDPLPVLTADAGQLGQLFQNLIANAIKFRGKDPPCVHVAAADNGVDWLFSVRDNGIGIDPQQVGRIFQVFQRLHTRAEYPGTGIGLAVSKTVVERHGGRIWVESQPGAGSAFLFTLPKNILKGGVDGSTEQTRRDSPDRG